MTSTDFTKMVPGFDFLHNLMKGAGSGLPTMGQWIAPTLDADEVDRRIKELRTVQFWLEQNAKLLGTTIQALEVQRMTLATLRTMNLPMSDLRDAMKLDASRFSKPPAAPAPAPRPAPAPEPEPEIEAEAEDEASAGAADDAAAGDKPPAVDPVQWWSALTRQFTELATNAIKDLPLPQAAMANSAEAATAGAAKTAAAPAKRKTTAAGKTARKAAPAKPAPRRAR